VRHTHTVALSGRNRRPVSDVLEKNSAQVITRLVLFPCDNDMNSASRNVKISSHKKLSSHKRHQTQKKSRTMQLHIISRKRCDGRSDRNKPTPSLSRSLPRTRRLAQRGIALPLRVGDGIASSFVSCQRLGRYVVGRKKRSATRHAHRACFRPSRSAEIPLQGVAASAPEESNQSSNYPVLRLNPVREHHTQLKPCHPEASAGGRKISTDPTHKVFRR
jgi:hypothetical protein